ncbi:LacI family DNA-binding transcriptional regulator [Nonomuraea sp. K274]|uniref:LacI family DNA-binding transcriptional regulator n=1 Tax=Nonomuraea cypriaca TaxID=1187855 RepID=A0A931ABL0_9ACTN|nr:LacI family DNA-binding transcriptional regulator [Nonomuraea cypriaca]MBF8189957.1 LacI family DNA-binding transcriptional regulator [Nonomuraea cypriaca]
MGKALGGESRPAAEPGGRANLRDVAQRAGVAVSTVSRVLSGHPDVSRATRDRVMAVVDELGYRPNVLGQMLRRGATRTVGFAIGDISNPLFAQIALGAEAVLGERGYSLLLSNSMGEPERELHNLRMLEQRRVDGLLLSVTTERDPKLLAALEGFDGPMVAIDREIRLTTGIGSVCSDHRTGISGAVRALHAAGHRHIALVAGLATLRPGRERIEAATGTAESLGVRCTVRSTAGFTALAPEGLLDLLKGPDAPTAFIAGNNQMLGSVLGAMEAAGTPDVSLVTCDEVPLLRFFRPRIAIVRRDPYRLGQESARMLVDCLEGGGTLKDLRLPTSFDPGDSIHPVA